MNIEKFNKTFEAVLFDGKTDLNEIANWCGGMIVELVDPSTGKINEDAYFIDIPGPEGYMTAGPNHYIFKDRNSFFTMPKEEFLHMVD